jgi:hypothetical protein
MPDWSLVNRSHVIAAVAECDRLGSKEFLQRYGFRRSTTYSLWHRGGEYDSKAVLGVAFFHATGTPVTWDEFEGGKAGAAKVLTDLGFDVVANEEETPPSRPRKTSSPKRRTAPEPKLNLCPKCYVALPASGICDFCD